MDKKPNLCETCVTEKRDGCGGADETITECDYYEEPCEGCDGEGTVTCASCQGTGIGQFGDPDTSKCGSCGGRGSIECDCAKDERQANADFLRKERKEEGRP